VKFRSVQILRAAAAGAVLLAHTSDNLTGQVGVDIFFVISGFIMGLVAPGRAPVEFLKSRFRRVYPPYLLAALPIACCAWLSGKLTLQRVLTDATLWPWWGSFERPTLGPGWTLSFELVFYAAVALTLWSKRLGTILALYFTVLVLGTMSGGLLGFIASPFYFEFLAGLAITKLPMSRHGGALGAVGIALIVVATPLAVAAPGGPNTVYEVQQSYIRVLLWGVPSALIVYGMVGAEELFASRRWAPIVYLGDASYSIYLWHDLIHLVVHVHWPIQALVMLVVGCLMYQFVERPLLRPFRTVPAKASGSRHEQPIRRVQAIGVSPAK
jgi:exopolysaccharide production protein ExoZ